MANIDGMELLESGETASSGGIFCLDRPAHTDITFEDGNGWTIETREGSNFILTRSHTIHSDHEILAEALQAAQRGLDMFSICRRQDLVIARSDEEYYCWWQEPQGIVLRAFVVARLGVTASVAYKIFDKDGNLKKTVDRMTPPPLATNWHESFRYFRLSQTDNDLFDAYRDTFLALEAILSYLVPLNPSEQEGAWLKRALSDVISRYGLEATHYVDVPLANPQEQIWQELYREVRNALFHAKSHRKHIIPHDSAERAQVQDSLQHLIRLYLDLAKNALGVHRHGTVVTYAGFEQFTRWRDTCTSFQISDDESLINDSDTVLNPNGGAVVDVAAVATPALDQPGLRMFTGTFNSRELADIKLLRKIGVITDGIPSELIQPDGIFTLNGIAELRINAGLKLDNKRSPRSFYEY